MSQVDSIRSEWTTFTKVNDWFNCNKVTLLESGLAIDEKMKLSDGTFAEISIGDVEADRIINFDETEHSFTTQYDKGGNRALRYGDSSLPKGKNKGTRGSSHTTGIYGSTAAGTAMPPCFIFDTNAKEKENFQLKASWCADLPKVKGKYGCPTTIESDSYVSVRKSGCTDEQLMQQLIEDVYLPLYPNVCKETKRDADGKFLCGPVIFKTDSGQGRLAATWESLEFRERMMEKGVFIVLGLPNSTSCTQEQDQLYQDFKAKTKAKITNLTDYGCFAELEDGVEGLVHVSEMDWTNKNVHPSKIVDLGQEVEVMVLDIDEERRRISLGIKQCFTNPWDDFASSMTKGDKISGKIKSITDFGIFIGLDGGIDGLVHLSDISWNETGEEAVRNFKKGEEVETVVLSIDAERERISLGIKQLSDDPFNNYVAENDKGAIVKGTVKEVDAKGAVIDLGNDIEASLKGSELSRDKVEDARNELTVGAEVEAKIINVDRKNRTISLSIKAKDVSDEKDAVKAHRKTETDTASPATIGDLIKAQMDK